MQTGNTLWHKPQLQGNYCNFWAKSCYLFRLVLVLVLTWPMKVLPFFGLELSSPWPSSWWKVTSGQMQQTWSWSYCSFDTSRWMTWCFWSFDQCPRRNYTLLRFIAILGIHTVYGHLSTTGLSSPYHRSRCTFHNWWTVSPVHFASAALTQSNFSFATALHHVHVNNV